MLGWNGTLLVGEGEMTSIELQTQILNRLTTIELYLAARGTLIDVTAAINDSLGAFGLITQLAELYRKQREASIDASSAIQAELKQLRKELAALREEIHGVTPEDAVLLKVQTKGERRRLKDEGRKTEG
jgi:hypothetical protein